jgi:YD repeat-containing protein
MTTATDPNGHTLTNTWDALGNLRTTTDALGRTTSYGYDSLNDVISTTNPAGVTISYTYDISGNLTSVQSPVTQTTGATTTRMLGIRPYLDVVWNVVTLPLQPSNPPTADAFLSALLTSSGGANAYIYTWNGTGFVPTSDNGGVFSGPNFTMQYGVGYLVVNDGAASYPVTGSAPATPVTEALSAGWNLVGLPASSGELASGILASLTAAGAAPLAIERWATTGWEVLSQLSPGVYTGSDFTIAPTDAYFIDLGSAVASWTLPVPMAVTTLSYDPAHPGDVTARTDPDGHTWQYTYDTDGDLHTASDPLTLDYVMAALCGLTRKGRATLVQFVETQWLLHPQLQEQPAIRRALQEFANALEREDQAERMPVYARRDVRLGADTKDLFGRLDALSYPQDGDDMSLSAVLMSLVIEFSLFCGSIHTPIKEPDVAVRVLEAMGAHLDRLNSDDRLTFIHYVRERALAEQRALGRTERIDLMESLAENYGLVHRAPGVTE